MTPAENVALRNGQAWKSYVVLELRECFAWLMWLWRNHGGKKVGCRSDLSCYL
ncbi:hypothetical protein ES702_03174 [subsurface metagenome]